MTTDDRPTVGQTNEQAYAITAEQCTGHTGTPVLSTPAMISMFEAVCGESAASHLESTETTVGIHVCVSHVAGSQLGEEVVVRSTLAEVKKDRFLTYEVTAHVGDRLLGEGTHPPAGRRATPTGLVPQPALAQARSSCSRALCFSLASPTVSSLTVS